MRRLTTRAFSSMRPNIAAAVTSARREEHGHTHSHSHSHSHGGGHGHSHGTIEKEIVGKNLRACQAATAAGGATNVFFCVTKLWVGSSGGSVALVADGFHALTDIVADVVSYVSISLSRKSFPRCHYPFGIGRLETTGAVLVAAILLFGGVLLLVQSVQQCASDAGAVGAALMVGLSTVVPAFVQKAGGTASAMRDHGTIHEQHTEGPTGSAHDHGHSHGTEGHGHSHFQLTEYDAATGKQMVMWSMVVLAAASVVCKEFLFQWTKRVGLRAGSRVVVANAYHHRTDAWSGGVALIGVLGQCVGLPGIDGLAGLAVSVSICKIGYGLLHGSILEFFDCQNAEDLANVRGKLQDFHLRVTSQSAVVADEGTSTPNSSSGTCNINASKVRFVNVFLIRHGHSYALHVTLLVSETWTAKQVQDAVDKLTELARTSLAVRDTYISLLPCSGQTHGRAAAQQAERNEDARTTTHDSLSEHHAEDSCGGDHGEEGHEGEDHYYAAGAEINPSLEKCIEVLAEFHGIQQRITYDLEKRTLPVSFATNECSDCARDFESLSIMYKLRLVNCT